MLQDFRLVLPEEVLSTGGLLLMLVAAWAGDRSAPLLTWLAILLLALAAILLPGLGLGVERCRRQRLLRPVRRRRLRGLRQDR